MPFPGLFDPELSKQGSFDPEINVSGVFDREYVSSPAPIGSVVNGTFLCLTIAFSTLPSSVCLPWAGSDDSFPNPPVATIVEEEPWIIPSVPINKPVAKLLSWGQEQEVVTLTVDESEYLAGPTKSKWINPALQLAKGIDEDIEVMIDETEYLSPVTRSQWQHIVSIDSNSDWVPAPSVIVEDTEWSVNGYKVSWLNTSIQLARGIEDEIAVIVEDEGWLSPLPHVQWRASIVSDPTDDWIPSPVVITLDEDLWLPPVPRPVVSTNLLYGTSAPVAATVSIVDESEQIYLSKYVSLWHPTIVSEPSSEWIPPVVAPPIFEEDSWLPLVRKSTTNVQLLCSTSGPTAQAINVVEDSEQPRLSKFVSLWYPRIVSDPTDNPVPIVTAVEEEPQLVVLAPPTILYAITPWSYGTEDIGSTEQVDDDYWIKPSKLVSLWRPTIVSDPTDNVVPVITTVDEEPQLVTLVPPPIIYAITPWSYGSEDLGGSIPVEDYWQHLVKPVAPYLNARFVNRTDELIVPAVTIVIDDDLFKPAILPRQTYSSLSLWSREQNEVSVQDQLVESEYWYVYVSPVGKFVLPNQWQFEQDEITIFVPPLPPPPPICFVTPVGVTFSTESPSDVVVTIEGPAQIVISNELPLNTTFVLESPASISLSPDSPTPTECDD